MGDDETKRMGDYELLAHLGSGAQGHVWKARCLVAGKEFVEEGAIVAIKMLGRTSGDPNEDKRFKRQAKILEQLEHPSICRYIDYFIDKEGEFDETQCLVTEYLDGQALDDRLRRHPHGLSWDELRPIMEDTIAGLAHAAKQEVYHRDLKPSNIFITSEGKAKIIDFGIARQAGGEETSSGDFRGSFDYMAPDFVLIEGFKGDERSDIFSMGVCLFKALTGELPFEALGDGAHIGYLNRWKQSGEVRPTFRHNAFRVLTKLKGFVQASLAVDLDERFQSFTEMLDALHQIKYRVVRHKGVADYELIDVLGRGGFGEVFKGRVIETGKLVAIKHLFAGRQESRFLKEAKLLQRYKHPDIVYYVDFIEIEGLGDDKEYFLVMEYLPGMPGAALNQRIRKARYGMEPAEVVEVFIHFLSALQFLHESPRPIIHRDIKPGNLYAPPGQPQKAKMFDLGVARDVSGTMTTGMIPGTLDYMAPEFAKPGSDRGTPQSDIYAMGVSMYEALTGRKPHPKLPKSDQEAFVQFVARAQNPPEVSYRFPVFREIPQLERICRRSLAANPDDRYRSAGQMLDDLNALMEQVAGERVDPEDAPTRATIADPALLERLRAHAAGRPAMIPESEMKDLLEEPSSRQEVERRPDWMDEEGSFEERPTTMPGSSSPALSPSAASPAVPAAGAKPKSSALKWIAIAAVVVALAVGSYLFLFRGDGRDGYAARVRELSQPEASEAYARRLLSLVAAGREKKLDDEETYEVWWDNQIAQLSELAERIPQAFAQAFDQSVEQADLSTAEALLGDWKNLGDAVPFMGLTQREFLVQADEMEGQIGRFYFTAAINEITRELPDSIDGGNLEAGESVAKKFRALRAKRWDEVPTSERDAEYEKIGSALTSRTEFFLREQKQRVLNQYAQGEDGAAGADLLAGMSDRAPSLVALAEPLYQSVLDEVGAVRLQFELEREARQNLANLEGAVPEVIENKDQLAQAQFAFEATTRELTARWQGISDQEKQTRLEAIRANLLNLAEAYVQSLSTAAQAWFENDETGPSRESEELQGLMDQAPDLMRSLGSSYAQAVSRVDQARRDRDDRFRRRKLEEEQNKIELAALQAKQAQQRAVAANREKFTSALAELRDQLPPINGGKMDMTLAEQAAQAIRAFSEQHWPDVTEEEKAGEIRRLTQTLRSQAIEHVEQLQSKAIEQFGMNLTEDAVAEWKELSGLGPSYPTLIGLIGSAYDQAVQEAESALLRARGVNAFSVALSELRSKIPGQIASDSDVTQAEQAARDFQRFKQAEWDMVSAEERDSSVSRLESTLTRRIQGYVIDLQSAAMERYDAMEDGGAQRLLLTSLKEQAPTLVGLIDEAYATAVDEVEKASVTYRQREAFREALARLDESIPSSAESAADIPRLETALLQYRETAAQSWPGINDLERDQQLAARRTTIEGLARSYLLRLQQEALAAYGKGSDGGPFALELRSMPSAAPTLVKQMESEFAQVVAAVNEAGSAWETSNEFQSTRSRILAAIPDAVRGVEDLTRLESAAKAYAAARGRNWEGVPAGEKLAAFDEIRSRLKDVATGHVDALRDQAVEQYRELKDADLVRENLMALGTIAPEVVAMLDPAYPAAVQAVDAARGDKERKLRDLAAERERLQRQQLEAERLAQVTGEEQQRLQQVETAWAQVQQQWRTGDDQNMAAYYEQILSKEFSLEQLQSAYQEIKRSFLNGIKERLSGVVASANQSIASFCAYLYQVDDPAFRSFSDNYRVTVERPPAVSFAMPNLREIEDVDMGYSKAELLRLQAWNKAGPTLNQEPTQASLSEQLKVLASASRKQGQVELASRCEMEAAMLVSEPAVFPAYLEDVGDPPEIFRWRAHASYQPEGSALDVLRDMERYATRGGQINDYDVRLAMFASYYSWRNAIEGESEYAGRVRRSLDAVLTRADEATAARAMDFIVQYIDEGTDDLEEFPGLYMMKALTMMKSRSAIAKQAANWLNSKVDQYAVRTDAIASQLALLQRLLGS